MVRFAIKEAELDEVILVPCFVSPFKSGTEATGAQRFAMLELALRDAGIGAARVSSFEIGRDGPSYSAETATHFAEAFPEVEWHWILGTDQWDGIEDWSRPETLRRILGFLVLTRNGEPVKERPGWKYEALPFSHPASSTAIRADFKGHRDWITPSVLAYCEAEGLYRP